jgi:hypothetical protein
MDGRRRPARQRIGRNSDVYGAILVKRLAPRQGAGFTTPYFMSANTSNTGTLPSARTCDV